MYWLCMCAMYACMYIRIIASTYMCSVCVSGLKPGWFIRAIQVMLCPGQADLICLIKYLFSLLVHVECGLIMGSGHNQIDELSILEVDGSESPDSPQDWRD